MKRIKDEKYIKIAIIVSIPLLLIWQYYLFNSGFLRPMLKGVEIQIVDGEYISDIDKYVVKLNDTVKLSMGDYIRIPPYSKNPDLTFKVLEGKESDNKDIVSINGNEMTALKEGYASIGVMNGSTLIKKVTVKVVNPKVENLEVVIDENLAYVGDSSKISFIVDTDYKEFKEPSIDYKSSNEDVLIIEDGEIKAVGVGTATIYVKSGDKESSRTFNIRAKVSLIDIENKIEIEVNQTIKLDPRIITSPQGLKHPKIEYTLVGAKLPVSRSIALVDNDGTILGLREGEDEIKITCGNKSKIVTIKVKKESIVNKTIENLEVIKEIVDNKLILTITWDALKGVDGYEVYARNNSSNEKEFKAVDFIEAKEDELGEKTRIQTTLQFDITDESDVDIDLYVVGIRDSEMTKPSNIVKVKYPESINNLNGYIDETNNSIKLTWDPIKVSGVKYNVYVKDNTKNEDTFTLYQQDITTNESIIAISEGNIDLEIYVVAEYDGKTIISNTINVK